MLKKIFFIFLLTFLTSTFALAETIQIGKNSLNFLIPDGYRDDTKNLNQNTIQALEQKRMKLLKRYVKNTSNNAIDHYVHLFINNELMNKVHIQKEKDLEKLLSQINDQFSKVINKKMNNLMKAGNELLSDMQVGIKMDQPIMIDTEKGDKYISAIILMKMINNKNEMLFYSLFDSEVIYACNTFFSMYSYCNFLNFDELHKHIQEVKEQSKLFRTMILDNNQDVWQDDNPSNNNDNLLVNHKDDNKSILFIAAVLILLLGLLLTRFLGKRNISQQKNKSGIDLDKK